MNGRQTRDQGEDMGFCMDMRIRRDLNVSRWIRAEEGMHEFPSRVCETVDVTLLLEMCLFFIRGSLWLHVIQAMLSATGPCSLGIPISPFLPQPNPTHDLGHGISTALLLLLTLLTLLLRLRTLPIPRPLLTPIPPTPRQPRREDPLDTLTRTRPSDRIPNASPYLLRHVVFHRDASLKLPALPSAYETRGVLVPRLVNDLIERAARHLELLLVLVVQLLPEETGQSPHHVAPPLRRHVLGHVEAVAAADDLCGVARVGAAGHDVFAFPAWFAGDAGVVEGDVGEGVD